MTVTMTVPETDPVFLQLQYCDKCSVARAVYRVWIDRFRLNQDGSSTSLDVVLCGHHYSANEAFIVSEGYEVDDA